MAHEHWRLRNISLVVIATNKVGPKGNSRYESRRQMAVTLPMDALQVTGAFWGKEIWPKIHYRVGIKLFSLRQGTITNQASVYGSMFRCYSVSKEVAVYNHALVANSKFPSIMRTRIQL